MIKIASGIGEFVFSLLFLSVFLYWVYITFIKKRNYVVF